MADKTVTHFRFHRQDADHETSVEEQAEITSLTLLSPNLSDGMTLLTAQNISRSAAVFAEDYPLPTKLSKVADYANHFILHQIEKAKGKTKRLVWAHPDALHDVTIFFTRKVWDKKIEEQDVINPIARFLVTQFILTKSSRASMHEALNHAVKHNQDLAALQDEIREQVDETMRTVFKGCMGTLAQTILQALPQLQKLLLENKFHE